jgi:hypothetical protein
MAEVGLIADLGIFALRWRRERQVCRSQCRLDFFG